MSRDPITEDDVKFIKKLSIEVIHKIRDYCLENEKNKQYKDEIDFKRNFLGLTTVLIGQNIKSISALCDINNPSLNKNLKTILRDSIEKAIEIYIDRKMEEKSNEL